MLSQLFIKNLAIVEQITLHFATGMNVLTGETGAGKSILLEALNLTLGDRASASVVRTACKQAEISAAFDIIKIPDVQQWLTEQELAAGDECMVRRIIAIDGRSKAYVNGHMVTLMQLKQLGEMLVNMHGQHQHHALLNTNYQQQLLDQYAAHDILLQTVANYFKEWTTLNNEYKRLTEQQSNQDKLQLLRYQMQEIEELALQPNELVSLEQEHKKLLKAEELLTTIQKVLQYVDAETEQNTILMQLYTAITSIKKLVQFAPELNTSVLLIEQAIIPLEELGTELQNFLDRLDINPDRLAQIERRLSDIYLLARKHNIVPEFLPEHYENLCGQRDEIENKNINLQEILQNIQIAQDNYFIVAEQLSKSRTKIAHSLAKKIAQQMKLLSMPHAVFNIKISKDLNKATSSGVDEIAFLVSTNPGQDLQPLHKIASGGELSRISLAMQVILTEKVQSPTLIFDEVDAGISGGVAEIVGKLLRVLGKQAQVICVTHLPQVAAQGDHHFKISKQQTANTTTTTITPVQGKARVEELARLLGGTSVTAQAIANAKTLLTGAES